MKKIYLAGGAIILAISAIVVADYFALFGTRTEYHFDLYELTFKTVDGKTGAPVINVHVNCFQQGNQDACTQKESARPGFVSVNIPVTKIITRTWLFKKNESIQQTLDPKLHIMFIHQDYARLVETIMIPSLMQLSREVMTVQMPAHIQYNDLTP